jgi:hypothetical protein
MDMNAFTDALQAVLHEHTESAECLFGYIRSQAQLGFTTEQFHVYRDNYFFRTATTSESVAKIALAAAKKGDLDAASSFAQNFYEETGEGVASRAHRSLLEVSHNIHAHRVFGLHWLNIADVHHSVRLLDESRVYREVQSELYDADNYIVALAASFAQESAADGMLRAFFQSFFQPYESFYYRGEFGCVSQYFTIHLDGMEQQHGDLALRALLRNCSGNSECNIAIESSTKFLQAQASLWRALASALKDTERIGRIISISESSR